MRNTPEYYGGNDNPYEPIKVMEANGWLEGFCYGCIHKYTVRNGKKTDDMIKDLGKARDYIDILIDYYERTSKCQSSKT